MSFLIVYLDDEELLCDVFKEYLQSDELKIHTFTEEAAAINYCKNNPVDLLCLDYSLMHQTGDEVAAIIDKNIPKILITGELSVTPTYNFIKIIKKPYRLAELKTHITDILMQH
ncbi:response regulator [Colwelliaceae bacterium 6441]